MFEQRVVWIRGSLNDLSATAAASQLMTLDSTGDEPIQLFINSGDGTLTAALTVMDTMAALGVPVEAVCTGRAEGPALGVLAVADRRLAARHARLRLHQEDIATAGTAAAITQELAQLQRQIETFIRWVSRATQQPAERVEIDLASGRYFELDEALEYHLIDEVWRGGVAGAA